eukprot:8524-Heterococcus_DN1.PRE.1
MASMAEAKNHPHLQVDEANMFESRLGGDYQLHDLAHSPLDRRNSKSAGSSRFGTSGPRLQASLTVSDNSSEVFCVRFSPDGKAGLAWRCLAHRCASGHLQPSLRRAMCWWL